MVLLGKTAMSILPSVRSETVSAKRSAPRASGCVSL